MGITVHEETGLFHLRNDKISYIMKVLPDGSLGQIYFGAAIADRNDFPYLPELAHRDMAPCPFPGDTTFSLEHIAREYPDYGTGDMRYPAYEILRSNGSKITAFKYKGYSVRPGKPLLPGLPATYTESDTEADTLEIYLEDKIIDAELTLRYTIFAELPVITRNAAFSSRGAQDLTLLKAMSLSLDLPDMDYKLFTLSGASLRERSAEMQKVHHGVQSIHSMRGHSSHQFNPFFALMRPDAGEASGEVIGISLVYSGNFLAQVEADTMDTLRIMIGIHPEAFSWPLGKGEIFETPEAVMVFSREGLNGMSQVFHRLYRTRLSRGVWRDRPRPILINSWEAVGMDFDEKKILRIARKAAELGAELFVLDDGWFGERNDNTSSLGDWYPSGTKFPGGLARLSAGIRELGMDLGIWIEPEMVSRKSKLYEAHPDWILGSEERTICEGRHQYVLDFSKAEVRDYIGDLIEKVLIEGEVSYVKWDMNRSISDMFSSGRNSREQGTIFHRQILGIYALYERLIGRFPDVLFESCASGGGRFDPGMLYYAPQGWVSDNTDGADRVRIQYGTSYVYPLSSMGSHVSAIPNRQTFRSVPLFARAAAAYFGTFGLELDPDLLSEEEQSEVREEILFMKRHRELIQFGVFYRLKNPFDGNEGAWIVVAQDGNAALAADFRFRMPANAGFRRLKLAGLDPGAEYRVTIYGATGGGGIGITLNYLMSGDELTEIGLILSDYASGVLDSELPKGDYQGLVIYLEKASGIL